MQMATFGGGCFWGVEAAFRRTPGVTTALVGYLGGSAEDPTYKDVCTGTTGHAEVVQLQFDPSVIPYKELLKTFWELHDPTTLNRQGRDVGTQYRSAIFYHTPEQREEAIASKAALEKSNRFPDPVVTEIAPASTFYLAEECHQQYLEKRGLVSCTVPSQPDEGTAG